MKTSQQLATSLVSLALMMGGAAPAPAPEPAATTTTVGVTISAHSAGKVPRRSLRVIVKGETLGVHARIKIRGLSGKATGVKRRDSGKRMTFKGLPLGRYKVSGQRIILGVQEAKASPKRVRLTVRRPLSKVVLRYRAGPPDAVTDLRVADRGLTWFLLDWALPKAAPNGTSMSPRLTEVVVRRAEGLTPPTSIDTGTQVPLGDQIGDPARDTGLAPNTNYAYAVFVRYSTGATSRAAPIQTGTLGAVAVDVGGSQDVWSTLSDGTVRNPRRHTTFSSALRVAVGKEHVCVLLTDRTVSCMGHNGYGELGDGTTVDSTTPVPVPGLNGVVDLAAGDYNTCAVLQDGTARCWGSWGPKTDLIPISTTPQPVAGLSGAVSMTLQVRYACAVLQDGTARCWGSNALGQLGDGTTDDSDTPVTVVGLTGILAIEAGRGFTCAVLQDGTARCWGYNSAGQLGNGTGTSSSTPVPVTGLTGALAIDAGGSHACAALQDGTARCWGHNGNGQLCNGTTTSSSSPVPVTGLIGVSGVGAGGATSCAITSDGWVKCWGGYPLSDMQMHTTPTPLQGL